MHSLFEFLNRIWDIQFGIEGLKIYLEGFCRRLQGASRTSGYSWGFEQRWHCRLDTRQTLLLRYNTA